MKGVKVLVSLIILASITSLFLLWVMVEGVYSLERNISGCGGPDLNQLGQLRMECNEEAEIQNCNAGTIHPVQGEPGCTGPICPGNSAFGGPPSYCVVWGCFLHSCSQTSCFDEIQNGDETDIDCGGPSCDPCSVGHGCSIDEDCESNIFCIEGTCTAPSCTDNIENGDETDIDCGGPSCEQCSVGEGCIINDDCVSNICNSGVCSIPQCDPGFEECSGQCVDLSHDDENCGECGNACAIDETCFEGMCDNIGCSENDDCPAGTFCDAGICVLNPL